VNNTKQTRRKRKASVEKKSENCYFDGRLVANYSAEYKFTLVDVEVCDRLL